MKDKQIETLQDDMAAQVQTLRDQVGGAEAENTQLKNDNKEWENKYAALEDQGVLNEKTNRVTEAQHFMDSEMYQEAANAAAAIDKNSLPPDLQETLQNIIDTSYPKLVEKYYNDGVSLYNKGKFDEAKAAFENARQYVKAGNDLADNILYNLGRVAVQQNDKDAAREYFQKVLDDYPDGDQAASAATRLKSIR